MNLKIGISSHVNLLNETYIEEYVHRKYLNVFKQLIKQGADLYWNGSTKINLDVHGTPLFNLLEHKRIFDESQGKTNVFKLFEYNVDDNLNEDKIKLLSEVFEAFTESLNLEQFQSIINDHIYHKDLYEKSLTNKQKIDLLQNNTNNQKVKF